MKLLIFIIGFALGLIIDRAVVYLKLKPIIEDINKIARELEYGAEEEKKGEN